MVVAPATALTLAMPALATGAADAGARTLLATRSGQDTGFDLSLPCPAGPQSQGAAVRRVIEQTFPPRGSLDLTVTETAGLVDAAGRRGYIAADLGGAEELPLTAGRWPAGAADAAVPESLAEQWGAGVGDTIDLGTRAST